MSSRIPFPKGFVLGTATASYQVEGAAFDDGRGESIWDRFARTPGKVKNGDNGDVACDHYHRMEEDLDLMSSLGVKSYRFSIAWPRVFPEKGKKLVQGLDFYKRLLNGLLEKNILPAATMYHWDLPQWIEDEGGWTVRSTVEHFQEYADLLFQELGDIVPMWITHNEPFCAAYLGYGFGVHAPGRTNWEDAARAAHHILLSHGQTVQRFRELGLKGQIGITLNPEQVYPATESKEDIAAAARQFAFANGWFMDPLFKGQYPDLAKEALFDKYVSDWSFVQDGDLKVIATPIDFLGVNYYSAGLVKHDPENSFLQASRVPTGRPQTDMGWDIYPQGLYDLLHTISREYTGSLPLYITENGAAFPDTVVDGEVHDLERIDYVRSHLQAAIDFVQDGGPLRGYYLWSLMDNFEWAEGYSKRFGMVYCDYETLERIPKDSAKWYADVIARHGLPVDVKA